MANVSYVRGEVTKLLDRWYLIRDCLIGSTAIKAAGDKYLPRPNPSDLSEENRERFRQYVDRAVFYNVTKRTHSGLVGQVFQSSPVVELPPLMAPLKADVDGAGVSLGQQAKKTLGHVLAYGRAGLLVDYPATSEPVSQQDLNEGSIRPTVIMLDPWDIINWRTKTVGARTLLSLVVIAERFVVEDDGFETKTDSQWRVLRLEEGTGIYRVEIWRDTDGVHKEHLRFYPRDASGNHLREIPFTFVGPINNDSNPDDPPLFDIAILNIAHYRNSADYEETCYMVGQPTPYIAGLTKSWVEDVLKGTVQLGSRAAVPLPEGGSMGLVQAEPNSMPKEAMEAKERQMVALGAKLVEPKSVQRTLGEARIEEASETSTLVASANNVADAYRKALAWAGSFIGITEGIEFDLSTDLEISRLSPQDRQQLISEWQAGAIAFEEMRHVLEKAGIAYIEIEKAKEVIASEAPGYLDTEAEGGADE